MRGIDARLVLFIIGAVVVYAACGLVFLAQVVIK